MKGYRFDVSCRHCGSPDFDHVNGTTHNNTEAVAVCCCQVCGASWTIVCLLRPLNDSDAAYRKRGWRARERANA